MNEDPRAAEQRRPGIAQAMDPRRVLDPALDRVIKAQVAARVQAQQTTTVFIATIVSLVTSAFGFVAALAWNTALQEIVQRKVPDNLFGLGPSGRELLYAVIVTLIAVIAVILIRGVSSRIVGKDVGGKSEHFS